MLAVILAVPVDLSAFRHAHSLRAGTDSVSLRWWKRGARARECTSRQERRRPVPFLLGLMRYLSTSTRMPGVSAVSSPAPSFFQNAYRGSSKYGAAMMRDSSNRKRLGRENWEVERLKQNRLFPWQLISWFSFSFRSWDTCRLPSCTQQAKSKTCQQITSDPGGSTHGEEITRLLSNLVSMAGRGRADSMYTYGIGKRSSCLRPNGAHSFRLCPKFCR